MIVEAVRQKIDDKCVVNKLGKEGCTVSLKDAPTPRLIVDFDKPCAPLTRNETRCDYLLVAGDFDNQSWVSPLELKRGNLRARTTANQLRAGAAAAEQLVPTTTQVNFRPIAAYGGGVHKAERNAFKDKRNMVTFRGAVETVRLIRCGAQLTKGLNS